MNELIQLEERQIGGGTIQTVNARDLHAFLEVGKDFTTWVKDRIQKYGFVEHHDFVTAQNLRSPVLGSTKASSVKPSASGMGRLKRHSVQIYEGTMSKQVITKCNCSWNTNF